MEPARVKLAIIVSSLLNVIGIIVVLMRRSGPVSSEERGYSRTRYRLEDRLIPFPAHVEIAQQKVLQESRLTHVVIPFHPRQEKRLINNMSSWSRYIPCDAQGGGRGDFGKNIGLIFFVSTKVEKNLEQRLLDHFARLPEHVRACFHSVVVRGGDLEGNQNNYLTGSRLQFEFMLDGNLGLADPKYVLYMEPDLVPIRPKWLEMLDELCRYPNDPFWIKGSAFRGSLSAMKTRIIYNLFHINGNAIYNLGNEGLRTFYHTMVRPYIRALYTDQSYDTDIFKFLLATSNYNYARLHAHQFQFTDAIRNMWHTNFTLESVRSESDIVVMIHGGTVVEESEEEDAAHLGAKAGVGLSRGLPLK